VDGWREAIELGARLGLFTAETARLACERLRQAKPEEVTAEDVASWVGRSPAEMINLLALAPLVPADTPTERLHETVLSRGGGNSALARALLGDLPTAKPGTPEAETPVVKPASLPALGRDLGRYHLVRELGRGGMGVVYEAHDAVLDRRVALKVLLVDGRVDNEAIERFEREARAAAQVSHPNIIPLHDVGRLPGELPLPYYTMELLQGQDMEWAIARDALSRRFSAEVIRQIALALDTAHRRGVLHRDVKPRNIFLRHAETVPILARSRLAPQSEFRGEEVHAVLLDFGLAKLTEHELAEHSGGTRDEQQVSTLTGSGQLLGTPAYMAPEQARGATGIDARTDVYGLGATLYHALTGHPPFEAPTIGRLLVAVMGSDPPPARQLNPKIEPELEAICTRCLQKDPVLRYQTAAEVATACESFLNSAREEELRRPLVSLEWAMQTLSSYNTPEGILKEAASYASTLLTCRNVAIALLDSDLQTASIAYAMGMDAETRKGVKVRVGQGLCGRVLAEGRPILVPDRITAPDPAWHDWERRFYGDGFIVAPLSAMSRVVLHKMNLFGAFMVGGKLGGKTFTRRDFDSLSLLVSQTAIALAGLPGVISSRMDERDGSSGADARDLGAAPSADPGGPPDSSVQRVSVALTLSDERLQATCAAACAQAQTLLRAGEDSLMVREMVRRQLLRTGVDEKTASLIVAIIFNLHSDRASKAAGGGAWYRVLSLLVFLTGGGLLVDTGAGSGAFRTVPTAVSLALMVGGPILYWARCGSRGDRLA